MPIAEDAQILRHSLDLLRRSEVALLGSVGPEGYPLVKAMLLVESEGLGTVWFGTNTSSRRVRDLRADGRASVYVVDQATFEGLLLVGDVEVREDQESRERLWRDGWDMYYPQGVTDPDYSVLRFTTRWGNYYHELRNTTFRV